MGKTTEAAPEPSSDEKDAPAAEEQVAPEDTSTKEKSVPEEKKQSTTAAQESKPKEKKEDVESLRKVIKLDSAEETKEETQKEDSPPDDEKQEETETTEDDLGDLVEEEPKSTKEIAPEPSLSREALEQKRAILQSIKDFDFQIKKNQEDIGSINQKLDGLSKDLDDLVSLYEIVSEQMNPFVGLSKVTKKRFDQLEHMTETLDSLKSRLDDLEASGGKTIMRTEKRQPRDTKATAPPEDQGFSLTDSDIDRIIELSFGTITIDDKIDMAIDNFIESLKAENVN